MGYFICKECGAYLNRNEIKDYYEWNNKKSIGWDYICPKCGYNNYKEIKLDEKV